MVETNEQSAVPVPVTRRQGSRGGWRWWRRRLARRPLLSQITTAIALAAMLPVVVASVIGLHLHERTQAASETRQLNTAAQLISATIDDYLDRHLQAVTLFDALVDAPSLRDPQRLSAHLQRVHAAAPGFVTMLVADETGRIIAASAGNKAVPPDVLGRSVVDRDYFRQAANHAPTYVSGAFRGRGFGDDVIVAISRGVRRDGAARLVAQGSLSLPALHERIVGRIHTDALCLVVVDQAGTIVLSTEPERWAPLSAAPERWAKPDGTESWISLTGANGWRVIAAPMEPMELLQTQRAWLLVALGLLTGLIIISLTSRWIAGRVLGPLNSLVQTVRNVDPPRTQAEALPDTPESWPDEIRLLHRQFISLFKRVLRDRERQNELLENSEHLRFALHDEVMRRQTIISERTAALEAANRELDRLARVDGLTGLSNRRVFDEELDIAWRAAQRQGSQVALIMLDVDRFKAYNDRFGHLAGDDCLRAVAAVIGDAPRRAGELAARYGGEEFAIILPDADGVSATRFAEALRARVQALSLRHPDSEAGVVTISLGVAAVFPAVGAVPASLIADADARLYAAKASGRNRVGS